MTPQAQLERLIPIDPNDPQTWKNSPCPADLSDVQRELTRVGGINDKGKPNFVIVYGQEYRTWDLGKMRIHFDEEAVPALHTPNRYAVTAEVYARAVEWVREQNTRRQNAYMNLDWVNFGALPDVADYLKNNELSDNYIKLPSDTNDMKVLMSLLPPGWMYIAGHFTFEHIGQQCCYVLQWFTPAEFGNPREWDAQRYDRAYVPETDQDEDMIDVLGPFPHEGQYENVVMRISRLETYEDKHPVEINRTITRDIHRFKTPTPHNVIPVLQELLQLRDRLTAEQKDPNFITKQRFKDFRDRQPVKDEAWRKEFRKRFDAAKPVGKGNPTNISANKNKVK